MNKLTEKQIEILMAIHNKGGKDVKLSAAELKHNKNFYYRIVKLEDMEFIKVIRIIGEKSIYTLTDKGYNALIKHKITDLSDALRKIGMEQLI
jgi:DNA-binding PadR family transcriptional regulator